jgi:hypothetical protein
MNRGQTICELCGDKVGLLQKHKQKNHSLSDRDLRQMGVWLESNRQKERS